MGLFKTSKTNKHDHVVAWDEELRVGYTTIDKGHAHEIQADPANPAIMRVAEANGHTHDEVVELKRAEPEERDESKVISETISLFRNAVDNERECRAKAVESEKFYAGEQWETTDKNTLAAEKRACLSINHTEAMVDTLTGYQRQNRQDIQFLPVEGGDQATADILTLLVKNISDNTGLVQEESAVFEEQVIQGRGNFHVFIDDSEDDPKIMVEAYPNHDVWYGPHARLDCRDLEYMFKARWMSPAAVSAIWPEKSKDVKAKYSDLQTIEELVPEPHNADKTAAYSQGNAIDSGLAPDLVDIAKKEIRVIECWRKEYFSAPVVVLASGERIVLETEADPGRLKSLPGASVEYKQRTRMRLTITAGSVLVEDLYPKLPKGVDFPLIPAYAKFRRNKWWGKIESAKDLQREINKRTCQTIDIINKVSSYGFFYDRNTFPSKDEQIRAKQNMARPGFLQEVTDTNRLPHKVDGPSFPSDVVNLQQLSLTSFNQVTGVNTELLTSPEASGAALIEKRRHGMTQNEFLFDALAQAKRRVAKYIVAYVQEIYTPERIARLVVGRASPEQQIDGQPVVEFSEQQIMDVLKTADLAEYDVAISESAWNPTTRRANFQQWSELARGGVQVPPDMLVELSDLPHKEKVKQSFAAQQQAAQQAEQAKMKMELGKTLIAKGGDPSQLMNGQ